MGLPLTLFYDAEDRIMIRVYYLETERIDNTDTVKGIEFIHNAILSIEGTLKKLIQDTTDIEHNGLIAVATSWREATPDEIAQLATLPPPPPPDPDYDRVCELLASSPEVITQPAIWELLRIFGKKLGYRF